MVLGLDSKDSLVYFPQNVLMYAYEHAGLLEQKDRRITVQWKIGNGKLGIEEKWLREYDKNL